MREWNKFEKADGLRDKLDEGGAERFDNEEN
jgi:hypothetical protein